MQCYITKSIITKIIVCLVIILLLFLLLYISKKKKSNTENEIMRNATTVEYEVINNINRIDEYQKRVYEESIKYNK